MIDASAAHALVLSDPRGIIRYWSSAAERLLGWTRADAEGQSLDLIVPPDHRERHWEGFWHAMQTGECKLDRATTNLPVRCADGATHVLPARFVFLWDARGEVAGAMAIFSTPTGSEQPFGPVLGARGSEGPAASSR